MSEFSSLSAHLDNLPQAASLRFYCMHNDMRVCGVYVCICVSTYIPGVLKPLYSHSDYFHLLSDLYLQLVVAPLLHWHLFLSVVALLVYVLNLHLVINEVSPPQKKNMSIITVKRFLEDPICSMNLCLSILRVYVHNVTCKSKVKLSL
jgi:hypothetical protein